MLLSYYLVLDRTLPGPIFEIRDTQRSDSVLKIEDIMEVATSGMFFDFQQWQFFQSLVLKRVEPILASDSNDNLNRFWDPTVCRFLRGA